MLDDQIDHSEIAQQEPTDANAILATFHSKVPQLHEPKDPQESAEVDATDAIRMKMKDILKDYSDSEDKTLVSDLLSQTIVAGCVAYGINPVELIIIPKELEKGHIAEVSRVKAGPMDIKQFFIDPAEIIFRVQLLSRYGNETAKNITDLMFVFMHETAHLGQSIFAEEDLKKSKQFDYASQPSEKHADEVALKYCQNLNKLIEGTQNSNRATELLRVGLPETIKDAELHGRPSM